ncbi:hypothetical protein [Streptomyces sp. CAU 1734]|uniref:hypothetical protein n=1 Tax=Streptomyces sp. CAU 1734 TaxID=3140360 RepID=UPI0032607C3F
MGWCSHPSPLPGRSLIPELKEHFARTGTGLPDAVTFSLSFEESWRSDDATLHYGGRAQTHDFDDGVDTGLTGLGRASERGKHPRVALDSGV